MPPYAVATQAVTTVDASGDRRTRRPARRRQVGGPDHLLQPRSQLRLSGCTPRGAYGLSAPQRPPARRRARRAQRRAARPAARAPVVLGRRVHRARPSPSPATAPATAPSGWRTPRPVDGLHLYAVEPRRGRRRLLRPGRRAPVAGNYDCSRSSTRSAMRSASSTATRPTASARCRPATDSIEYSVMTYRAFIGPAPGTATTRPGASPQTFMMLRHRRPAAPVRRRLHHQRRRHHLFVEPGHRRHLRQRRRSPSARRQPDLPDHLGRRRHRHLRPLRLRDQPRHRPRPGRPLDLRRRRSSPISAAARTAATPAATSSTRSSSRATRAR